MKIVKLAVLVVGVLATLMGLLWAGQGLGLIMWPASSFMLAQPQWALYGGILAALGIGAIWWSRRR